MPFCRWSPVHPSGERIGRNLSFAAEGSCVLASLSSFVSWVLTDGDHRRTGPLAIKVSGQFLCVALESQLR